MSYHSSQPSPQQERVWHLMQRHGTSAFRLRARIQVQGADARRVASACEALAADEAVLRQRWQRHPSLDLPLVRELSAQETAAESLRVTAHCSDEGCIVELDLPAYCADEASVLLLAHRLADRLDGKSFRNDDLTPFSLVADWERGLAKDDDAALGRGVWRERLAEIRAATAEWPAAPVAGDVWHPERIEVALRADLREFLQALDKGVLPGAALLAAWGVVVGRRMGVALPLGVRLDGRGEEALSGVVGPLARVAPVSLAFRFDRQLSSAVETARAALFDSQTRQDCFAWTIGSTSPGDVQATAAIGHARRAPDTMICKGDVAVTVHLQSCVEDVFLYRLIDGSDRLILEYDRDARGTADAERMLSGLVTFLEAARQAPQTSIRELPVLGAREAAQLLAAAVPVESAPAAPLIRTFLDTARQHPDRVAIESDGHRSVTYGRLDEWSSLLASSLIDANVGLEHVVAICLPPSAGLAASLLAVMKCGAAFACLEPTHPPKRLAALLRRLRPVAIVADTELDPALATVCDEAGVRRITPEGRGGTPDETIRTVTAPGEPLRVPAALAYAMFTSGSTGEPRCVGVPRRALDRQIDWFVRRFALAPGARVLARTSPAFDASLWEWLATFSAGATVVAAPGAGLDVPLGPAIARGAATHVQSVPNLLELVLMHEPAALTGLRTVFAGGEILSREMAVRIAEQAPVVNLYGPTECCVQIAAWQGDPTKLHGPVPVGASSDGTVLVVAASQAELGALGAVGTLMAGGECLSRGYLDDPSATAAAFVPHPWSKEGERLYLTGDLARIDDADGLLVLGRRDQQVKMRGARVEPAEVATTLRSVPGVADCAVLVERPDGKHDVLVAVYVVDDAAPAEFEEVLPHEAVCLMPGYMVPARFVAVHSLPRLASGKLDMAQLRRLTSHRGYEAPVTPTERLVAEIWREVLGTVRVGRHDGFFDLGGHSILLLRALSRLRVALGQEVPIRFFHDARDVASLSRLIDAAVAKPAQERSNV